MRVNVSRLAFSFRMMAPAKTATSVKAGSVVQDSVPLNPWPRPRLSRFRNPLLLCHRLSYRMDQAAPLIRNAAAAIAAMASVPKCLCKTHVSKHLTAPQGYNVLAVNVSIRPPSGQPAQRVRNTINARANFVYREPANLLVNYPRTRKQRLGSYKFAMCVSQLLVMLASSLGNL